MQIVREVEARELKINLTEDELFQAHTEYVLLNNYDYIVEWLADKHGLTAEQMQVLRNEKYLIDKLYQEKDILENKYYHDEEEAVALAYEKFKDEIQEVI